MKHLALVLLPLSLVATACGPGSGGGTAACTANLLPGDLVLTEVMANPFGDDAGNEWFEMYNASSSAIDMTGVVLASSRDDGSQEKVHTMTQIVVQPAEYLVAGDVLPDLAPAYVGYGYGGDLGTLRNTGGLLTIRCDSTEVDAMHYPAAGGDGIASGLDGNIAPDHLANDDLANLCDATVEFQPNLFGSPGQANQPCQVVVPGTCNDGGTARPVVKPAVGDLLITEVTPDPSKVADTKGEWFEVYANANVDLNGVVAGTTAGSPKLSIDNPDCVPVTAGSYVVFARSDVPADNGGLPQVDYTFNFSLGNASGSLFVGVGDTVLDQIAWTGSTSGKSRALKPDQYDATLNDDEANWVDCSATYGSGDSGTPGAGNDTCSVPDGMCNDAGTLRPIVPPTMGQLLVTEALANPAGTTTVNDPGHEWFELTALADFDLNGVELGKAGTVAQTVTSVDCIPVTSGSHLVFAQSTDPATNGGLPKVDFVKTFTLNNTSGTVNVGLGGTVFQTLTYGSATDGKSTQLDPGGVTVCVTPATTPYGTTTDLGTPGVDNPACP